MTRYFLRKRKTDRHRSPLPNLQVRAFLSCTNHSDCALITRHALFLFLGSCCTQHFTAHFLTIITFLSTEISLIYRTYLLNTLSLSIDSPSESHQTSRTRTSTPLAKSITNHHNTAMPGFNSFLIGRGPFVLRPDSTPPPDSDSETEVIRKAVRRQQKTQNAKVTTLYDVTMSRPAVQRGHEAMLKLRIKLKEQGERLHDAGLAKPKDRRVILATFTDANNLVLQDGGAVLRVLSTTTGPVEDLAEGLRILGRLMGEIEGKMGLEDAEKMQGVYRREIGKPLREMCGVFGQALEDRGIWRRKG